MEAHEYPYARRPVVSLDDRFVMLRDGKATLKPIASKKKACQLPCGEGTSWDQMYDFPKSADQVAWDAVAAKRDAYEKALIAQRDTAIDEIMLGTGAAVNDIIARFGVGVDAK